jgi:hypothetical protein
MKRLFVLASSLLALAACSPKTETASAPAASTPAPAAEPAPAPASLAPDVAAAAARGDADPRIPTVDPATINDTSSVGDVMHAYVIPGSETLFAQESGDPPKDDAAWATLQKATADIIKGAELLKAPGRSKGPGWDQTVDTVIKATKVSADKLARKNTDDLVFDDGDMMAGCTSCHQKFRDLNPPKGGLVDDKAPAKPN